jgi:acyl carrier protein
VTQQTDDEIIQAAKTILHRLAPEADLDKLDRNAGIRNALDIDSFDFLNFIIGIHARFGVDTPESDYAQLQTLNGVARYVQDRKSSGQSQ